MQDDIDIPDRLGKSEVIIESNVTRRREFPELQCDIASLSCTIIFTVATIPSSTPDRSVSVTVARE